MGLFSFLKNTGSKLFDKKAEEKATATKEASEKSNAVANQQKAILLKGIVQGHNLPIDNLDIKVDGDNVTVYGECDSQADKEKVILAIGNVEGVATVDDKIAVVNPTPEATFYEVKKGDSLSKIAKEHYDDYMKYMIIFEANKPMLKDPDKIYPGQVLRIPHLED